MFFIVVGVVGHLLAARFKKFGTDIANYASLPNNFILLLFILYIIFFFHIVSILRFWDIWFPETTAYWLWWCFKFSVSSICSFKKTKQGVFGQGPSGVWQWKFVSRSFEWGHLTSDLLDRTFFFKWWDMNPTGWGLCRWGVLVFVFGLQ